MKKRRGDASEERRQERVEINLLDEEEGRSTRGGRRGCTLPFTMALLAMGALIAARSALG